MVINLMLLIAVLLLLNPLLLGLHLLSPKYGILPVVSTAAALVAVLRFSSAVGVYVTVSPDLRFTFASNVLIPTILLIVLIIYITEGVVPARLTIAAMVGVEILAMLLYNLMSVQLRLPGGGSLAGLPAEDLLINPTIQITLASITAFIVDLIAIAILFQALVNFAPRLPLWVCAGITLTAALALNSAVFWALAADDFAQFVDFFAGSLLGSVVSGLLLTPLLAVYLHYIAPRLLHFTGLERRPVFALLFGTFAQVERRLAEREQQLDEVTRMYSSQLQDERARALRIQELVNEIVHDMRSPITGLNLRIDLIRRSIDPAQRDAHIAAMRLSVERLTQLAASAAELVRLEHTPEDVLMPHDLNALARTLVEQFRPLAEAKGLALYVEAADDPLPIMLNREAMERALGNLLENAVRYTRSGSIRVRVQRTDDCAMLTVSDTGIGIQPEMQKRIFDRYFRANREEHAAEGSGLGLAIAQRIIEAGHNGAITVESTPGAGTTFIVTLPLV